MLAGMFFVILGALFIFDNLGLLNGRVWDFAWPMLIICLGVSMIVKHTGRNRGSKTQREK